MFTTINYVLSSHLRLQHFCLVMPTLKNMEIVFDTKIKH